MVIKSYTSDKPKLGEYREGLQCIKVTKINYWDCNMREQVQYVNGKPYKVLWAGEPTIPS